MVKSKKKKAALIVLGIFLIIIILIVIMFSNLVATMKKGEETLATMTFSDIDISSIKNGTYTGEFNAGLVYVKVETTVLDGKITKIKLIKHDNGKGKAAESIIDTMIEKQTTDVDMVSGATGSSKVIRKAVENSLLGNN